jgi:hypothetical protein
LLLLRRNESGDDSGSCVAKSMFPRDLWPEEFEFPSCYLCNNGTSKHDTIFGYYSMRLDFNEDNRSPADLERQQKLRHEIAKRYPDALPDSEEPIFRVGHIIIPSPVAVSVDTKPAVREAMRAIGEKNWPMHSSIAK